MSIIDARPVPGDTDTPEQAHAALTTALAAKNSRPQVDTRIGEVRVVVGAAGLTTITRDRETITLIPEEAVPLARMLLDHFRGQQ